MESIASIYFTPKFPAVTSEYSKRFGEMSDDHKDLSSFILARTKDGLTYQDISDRAARKGHKITRSYISKLVSGAAGNISVEKLKALAVGLGVVEDEIFAVAFGKKLVEEKITDALAGAAFSGYSKLSKKDKAELAASLQMLNNEIERRLAQTENK